MLTPDSINTLPRVSNLLRAPRAATGSRISLRKVRRLHLPVVDSVPLVRTFKVGTVGYINDGDMNVTFVQVTHRTQSIMYMRAASQLLGDLLDRESALARLCEEPVIAYDITRLPYGELILWNHKTVGPSDIIAF